MLIRALLRLAAAGLLMFAAAVAGPPDGSLSDLPVPANLRLMTPPPPPVS